MIPHRMQLVGYARRSASSPQKARLASSATLAGLACGRSWMRSYRGDPRPAPSLRTLGIWPVSASRRDRQRVAIFCSQYQTLPTRSVRSTSFCPATQRKSIRRCTPHGAKPAKASHSSDPKLQVGKRPCTTWSTPKSREPLMQSPYETPAGTGSPTPNSESTRTRSPTAFARRECETAMSSGSSSAATLGWPSPQSPFCGPARYCSCSTLPTQLAECAT